MPRRFYILFILTTLLLLFQPGNSPYFQLFAFHADTFHDETKSKEVKIHPIPVLRWPYGPDEVSAESVYVVDLPSFTPVYERNIHRKLFPASTTKVITALVALDLFKPDDVVTVKKATNEGQLMELVPNEKITVENLLYGTLVHSGNDAAYALAEHLGINEFINRMNQKAESLGMKDSHFTNPPGFDDPQQQTTAFDLALAARELINKPYLRKIVGTKEIIISDVDYKIFHKLTNVNKLLGEVQGLGGLKTGYTESAGENLISFYKSNGHEYIIVILKSTDRFEDTKKVVQWIQVNVEYISPQ